MMFPRLVVTKVIVKNSPIYNEIPLELDDKLIDHLAMMQNVMDKRPEVEIVDWKIEYRNTR